MLIREIDTRDKGDVRQFLDLPFKIYKGNKQWVPPLRLDAKKQLDRNAHAFYETSDAAFFMAFSDRGEPTGRIAVLDNERYNAHKNTRTAFFYLFEVVDDFKTAEALFGAAFDWARKRGLNAILGPKGFTPLNGLGMLTRGFEHRPALGIPYNPPYYPEFIERLGFAEIREVLSGYMNREHHLPDKIAIIAERVREKRGLVVEQYESRADLRNAIPKIKELYNGSLTEPSGNAPLTEAEIGQMANQILWFADPRLIKILTKDKRPVGFLFAYPDISVALQKTKGKLFPFGWLRILIELKTTRWINFNGAGIIEEYRGLGGTAVLFHEMAESVLAGRYREADLVQIGTENDRMQREMSSFGINFYKSHKIYERTL